MALPNPVDKGPVAVSEVEKKNATLNLLLAVSAVDLLVIVAYFYLVLDRGWDPTVSLLLLLGVSMATGLFFAWQKGKIDKGK